MSPAKFIFSLVCIVFSLTAFAKRSGVIEVETNDRLMKEVYLSLGRSTVLSFDDKPTKVVLGNSNYFNVEFIGNDLTIQPLSNVETNLFVYTQKQSKYGFILKPGTSSLYSDIVYVRWKKSPSLVSKTENKIVSRSLKKPPKVVLSIKRLEFQLIKISILENEKTYLFDFEIRNSSKGNIALNSSDVYLQQNRKRFLEQKLVLEKDQINSGEKLRARIIAKLDSSKSLSINFLHQKKMVQEIISKEYL
jgi:hypothetical protein